MFVYQLPVTECQAGYVFEWFADSKLYPAPYHHIAHQFDLHKIVFILRADIAQGAFFRNIGIALFVLSAYRNWYETKR